MTKSFHLGRLIFTEIFVAFIVGGVPILISYFSTGPNGVEKMISSLMPPDTLIWYSIWLTAAAVATDFLSRFLYKKTDLANAIWNLIDDISSQVSPSAQAILRIAAGVMLTFVVLWLIVDYQSFHVGQGLYFMCFGILALIEAASLRWVELWLAKNWGRRKFDYAL